MRRASALFILLFSLTLSAQHYDGKIDIPGRPLAIQIDVEGSGAKISIPAQSFHNVALANVKLEGGVFVADMAGIPGNPHFDGKFSADRKTISGTFSQNGASLPFDLAQGADATAKAGDAMSGFEGFANTALPAWNVPGASMAIVNGGKVVYAKGFGKRDVKNNLPVTPDTLFAIGSCTKAFTTFVLGQLVDEGKVDWDKPVGRYLPGFRLYDTVASQELTPRDLVTHRSGLPRHDMVWYNNQTLTRKDIVERLQYLPPNAELREKWQYNNLMYLTAGYLIEQMTGKAWEQAVRERVFTPVGMTHSNFADADSQKTTDFAKPYREDHGKVVEIPFCEVGNMGPAGSINSTVSDMARWMLVQLGDEHRDLVQASTLKTLHTPQMTLGQLPQEPEFGPAAYAMGWIVDSYRGHLRLQHGGNIDGFSALVTLFPNDDTGIVVLSNANGTALPGVLTLHAADRLFKLEPKDWNGTRLARKKAGQDLDKEAEAKKNAVRKTGTKPAHAIAEYAGDYENPGYGIIRIGRTGEALSVSYNGLTAPLEHWHYETFNAQKGDDPTLENTKLTFVTDVNGTVSSLSVIMDPLVPATTFAKKADAKLSDPAFLKPFTGSYELGPQIIDVSLHGNQLVMTLTGQPPYTLDPALEDWFELKGLNGYRVKFDAKSLTLSQPDGVYTAKRK